MPITRTLVETVRSRIGIDPTLSTKSLARELNTKETDVITALPLSMRRKARPEALEAIWERMSSWREPVFNADQCARGVLASGLPKALFRNGKILLDGLLPSVGRQIAISDIAQTWFISGLREDGEESRCVKFFRQDGTELFSISLGRDEHGRLNAGELAGFEAMREEFGVVPVPRNRCAGCGKCTCGQKKNAA